MTSLYLTSSFTKKFSLQKYNFKFDILEKVCYNNYPLTNIQEFSNLKIGVCHCGLFYVQKGYPVNVSLTRLMSLNWPYKIRCPISSLDD